MRPDNQVICFLLGLEFVYLIVRELFVESVVSSFLDIRSLGMLRIIESIILMIGFLTLVSLVRAIVRKIMYFVGLLFLMILDCPRDKPIVILVLFMIQANVKIRVILLFFVQKFNQMDRFLGCKRMIDVSVVEDNHTIRAGLKVLIDGTEGYRCVAVYPDCEQLLSDISTIIPDVLLMDIGLPGMSGIVGVQEVKKIIPDLIILIFTIYEDHDSIFDSLSAGACGYLVKNTPPARLLEAIREAYHGGSPMSSHIAGRSLIISSRRMYTRRYPIQRL